MPAWARFSSVAAQDMRQSAPAASAATCRLRNPRCTKLLRFTGDVLERRATLLHFIGGAPKATDKEALRLPAGERIERRGGQALVSNRLDPGQEGEQDHGDDAFQREHQPVAQPLAPGIGGRR